MIEKEDYRLPEKRSNDKPKQKVDPETLAYLESLSWRPFDMEW